MLARKVNFICDNFILIFGMELKFEMIKNPWFYCSLLWIAYGIRTLYVTKTSMLSKYIYLFCFGKVNAQKMYYLRRIEYVQLFAYDG